MLYLYGFKIMGVQAPLCTKSFAAKTLKII